MAPAASLRELLEGCPSALLQSLREELDDLPEVRDLLDRALVDEPPFSVREGEFIREGFDPEVDRLRSILHGGKGIAVGLGVILAWYWPIGLSLLGMFIVAVAITKYVSVGSLAAAIGLPIAACAVFPYSSLGLKFCMAMIGITVVWAHRANIQKLMTGKESKLSFTKRVTEPDDK